MAKTAPAAKTHTVELAREKETKNAFRFIETPEEGKPPVVGSMYLPKWVVGEAQTVTVTVTVG